MRNVLKVIIVVVTFALAGCVYPGYSYVRGGSGGGYYTGNGYYEGGGYAPAYPGYYGYYDGCCYYGPSVDIGLGYYGQYYGHYYGRGYRGSRGWDGHSWRGNGSHGTWHGSSSQHGRSSHQGGSRHHH